MRVAIGYLGNLSFSEIVTVAKFVRKCNIRRESLEVLNFWCFSYQNNTKAYVHVTEEIYNKTTLYLRELNIIPDEKEIEWYNDCRDVLPSINNSCRIITDNENKVGFVPRILSYDHNICMWVDYQIMYNQKYPKKIKGIKYWRYNN